MGKRILALAVLGAVAAGGGAARADVVYSNDFSSNAAGFTGGTLTTAPSGEQFLGFGGAGGGATLSLTGLGPHTGLSVSFSLYAIGSVDGNGTIIYGGGTGDYFTVTYAGATSGTLFNQAFANYGAGETQSYPAGGSAPGTGATSLNALGYTGFPATNPNIQDAEYTFTPTLTDNAGTISLTFQDNTNEGASNEFYGIDNVVVTTTGVPAPVPEPATLALLGTGLVGLGIVRRRRNG